MRKALQGLLSTAALVVPGTVWAQASASDFTSAARYDLERRLTGTISPDPDGGGPLRYPAVRSIYDPAGRLIRVEKGELATWQPETIDPLNWVGFTIANQIDTTYDAMDRKVVERIWAGGLNYTVTQYSYDLVGRLECTAVRMNPAAFTSLPASACTLGAEGAHGPDRITRNFYDDAGQLMQVRKAVGTSFEQAYVGYTYTGNGKQEYVIDANGNKARLVYDGHDRQSQWQFPSSAIAGTVNTNDREEYGYDENGNRTSLRKRDGRTFTYAYDALNRMTAKIVPDACVAGFACTNVPASMTRDVYYSYDARGLRTAARFDSAGGADAVTSGYNGFGRLTSSTTSMGGATRTLNYQYDADGNRIVVTHPDSNFINYHRDGLGRIYYTALNNSIPLFYPPYDNTGHVSVLYRWVGGAWNNHTVYGRDGLSRPTSATDSFSSSGYNVISYFSYNPASQITSRTRSNTAYSHTGYVGTNLGYTVNGLNQYSAVAGASYGYDANGNLTADGNFAYTYDAENRLVVTSAGANLVYDPLGRLYQTSGGAAGVTQFLYDGDQLTAEYDASGTMLRRYVHGDGEDDPLVWYEGAGTVSPRYLYSDHQGSVVAVTDSAGNVLKVNTYDEYGTPSDPNHPNAGRFQYTGQAWIPELGMYHYKARIYSPKLGRFLQTDPIGYEGGFSLYNYVGNNPINSKDPNGTSDLNFLTAEFDKPGEHEFGRDMDLPGTFTVVSHGDTNGIGRRTAPWSERKWDFPSASDLANSIKSASSRSGESLHRVALLACHVGFAGAAYAVALHNELKVPVMAATNLVTWSRDKNNSSVIHLGFQQGGSFVVVGGSFADFGIRIPSGAKVIGLSYNSETKTATATYTYQKTGSILTWKGKANGKIP